MERAAPSRRLSSWPQYEKSGIGRSVWSADVSGLKMGGGGRCPAKRPPVPANWVAFIIAIKNVHRDTEQSAYCCAQSLSGNFNACSACYGTAKEGGHANVAKHLQSTAAGSANAAISECRAHGKPVGLTCTCDRTQARSKCCADCSAWRRRRGGEARRVAEPHDRVHVRHLQLGAEVASV